MNGWDEVAGMFEGGLVDRVLAVVAMLASIRPLMQGALGPRSHVSWRRAVFLLAGGCAAAVGAVGLLALEAQLLARPFYLPTWLGGSLAFMGGMLGASTILAGRAPDGLTENAAIRTATQSVAMTLYVAAPVLTLAGLGITRVARATLPWTLARTRWAGAVEGVILLLLCAVPRDPTLGGLRDLAPILRGGA